MDNHNSWTPHQKWDYWWKRSLQLIFTWFRAHLIKSEAQVNTIRVHFIYERNLIKVVIKANQRKDLLVKLWGNSLNVPEAIPKELRVYLSSDNSHFIRHHGKGSYRLGIDQFRHIKPILRYRHGAHYIHSNWCVIDLITYSASPIIPFINNWNRPRDEQCYTYEMIADLCSIITRTCKRQMGEINTIDFLPTPVII